MRLAQQIIKIFALALATIIIISIFGAVIGGVLLVGNLIGDGDSLPWATDQEITVIEEVAPQNIQYLDVNVKASNVRIRRSDDGDDSVRVESNNQYIAVWNDNNKFSIIEKSHGLFGFGSAGDVTIYIRNDIKLDEVVIEIGAGTLSVDQLQAKTLSLNLGAGKVNINSLKVTDHAHIEGGTGKTTINDGELHDAKIELGVGKTDIRARLSGYSLIKTGVGKLDLVLLGNADDYQITIDKGIGSVELDGESLRDGSRYGDGGNRVDLESGVGAIEIKIEEG